MTDKLCFAKNLIEHGGSIKGVAAQMNIIPELGLTGVSLANLAGVPSTKLLYSAIADFLGKSVKESHLNVKVVEVPEEVLKQYEGVYVSGEGAEYDVKVEDGKLCIKADGMNIDEVKPIGEDLFMVSFREQEISLRFIKDENQKVVRCYFGFRQIPKVE